MGSDPVASDDLSSSARLQVWAALAWLYLDIDPLVVISAVAAALLDSRLSLAELRRIDREQVAPALWSAWWDGRWSVTPRADDPCIRRITSGLQGPRWRRFVRRWATRPITRMITRDRWRELEPLLTRGRVA